MFKLRHHLVLGFFIAALGCASPPPPEISGVATCMQEALLSSGLATNVLIQQSSGWPIVVFDYMSASGATVRAELELGAEENPSGTIQGRYLFLNSLEGLEDWNHVGELVENQCNAAQVLLFHATIRG